MIKIIITFFNIIMGIDYINIYSHDHYLHLYIYVNMMIYDYVNMK